MRGIALANLDREKSKNVIGYLILLEQLFWAKDPKTCLVGGEKNKRLSWVVELLSLSVVYWVAR